MKKLSASTCNCPDMEMGKPMKMPTASSMMHMATEKMSDSFGRAHKPGNQESRGERSAKREGRRDDGP